MRTTDRLGHGRRRNRMKNGEKFREQIGSEINEYCYGQAFPCAIRKVMGREKGTSECPAKDLNYNEECCIICHKESFEWLNAEYKEEILSDDEKDIIRSMIYYLQKIGCTVNYVIKDVNKNGIAYFMIDYENHTVGYSEMMSSPYFKKDKFNGMEIGKEYTLEELGL